MTIIFPSVLRALALRLDAINGSERLNKEQQLVFKGVLPYFGLQLEFCGAENRR
jgi:hypothetical protein